MSEALALLFSYGTLQQVEAQLSTFGRQLSGRADQLPRFELAEVPIRDPSLAASTGRTHHANVLFNGRDDSAVAGTAYEVTEDELASADRYEQRAEYRRIRVTLASGRHAWVYVDAHTSPKRI